MTPPAEPDPDLTSGAIVDIVKGMWSSSESR